MLNPAFNICLWRESEPDPSVWFLGGLFHAVDSVVNAGHYLVELLVEVDVPV